MDLYLDENGDLGFDFKKPFRQGGSSRFLTFSFLLVPEHLSHFPKRIVRKFYVKKKQPSRVVLKGRSLTISEKNDFAEQAVHLFVRKPEIKLFTVTIRKKTVNNAIQQDMRRLFNMIPHFGLMEKIKHAAEIKFIPNPRSIRTKNGNHLADFLQTELWFENDSDTVLENRPKESLRELNLQFLDLIGHIVWKRYEDNETEAYDILKGGSDPAPWWETLADQ